MITRHYRWLILPVWSVLIVLSLVSAPQWTDAQGIEIAPTPTPTPLPSIVGSTYRSPHGWSMSWNDPWNGSVEFNQSVYEYSWRDDVLNLFNDNYPELRVQIATEGSDRSVCYDLTRNREATVGTDGAPLKYEGDSWHSWIVMLSSDGTVRYEECRRLNQGTDASPLGTYVIFTATAPVDTYQASANEIEALAGNLRPSPDALLRPTPTPLPPEPTPDPRAGMEDQLSAGSFTEPVHGWSVNWSAEEYVATVQPTEDRWGSDLRLVNEATSISIFYRDAGIQYPFEQGEMVGCSFIGYEQLGGFGFEDATDQIDESRLPAFPGNTDTLLMQQRAGSGEGKIFSMCVDLGNGQGYLRIAVGYNGSEPFEVVDFLEVVYPAVDAVTLP